MAQRFWTVYRTHPPNADHLRERVRDALRCFTLAIAVVALSMSAIRAGAVNEFAWRFRPLIVFASSPNAPELLTQRSMLSAVQDAMQERNILWIEVVGDQVSVVNGVAQAATASVLRSDYSVATDQFAVILVGKDTGVKLRSAKPVTAGDLFSLIDAMPMRQREIRHE